MTKWTSVPARPETRDRIRQLKPKGERTTRAGVTTDEIINQALDALEEKRGND